MDLLDLLHTGKKEKEEETVRSGPLQGPVVYGTTGPYEKGIESLARAIRQADAILVGEGSGLLRQPAWISAESGCCSIFLILWQNTT